MCTGLPPGRQRMESQPLTHARQALAHPGLCVQLGFGVARRAAAQRALS